MVRQWFLMAAVVFPGLAAGQVSPRDDGAKCDGRTDDTAALQSWWARLMRDGGAGALPPGVCVARAPLVWDLSARLSGVRVNGASQGQSVLDLRAVKTGTPLLVTAAGGMFYSHFADFTVLTDIAGPGAQLGRPALTDAMNGFTLTQMEFKNAANADGAVALQVNGCFNCDFQTVTTNTGGGSTSGGGNGVSLQVRYAAFSRFMGSFSNAGTGLHLTGGYVFGNVFEALDIEVTGTAVRIDSPQAARNSFIGGQFAGVTGLDFVAGSSNVVSNANIVPYRGGVAVAGTAGLWLQQPGTGVATPPVPASGSAVPNATGRLVMVLVFGGAVSRIAVGGSAYPIAQGSVLVRPGESVSLVYTSPPSWEWRPVP
jgi:hypothetical protein